MPFSEQDRTRSERGSAATAADPAAEPIDALLTRLGTNAATGLSPKEASRRPDAAGGAPLFRASPRSLGLCLQRMLREPAQWLLLAVSVISLFFERVGLGLFCLLLTAGHTLLCACLLYRADRVDAAMQAAYDTPLCRVLRGGRILRISADSIVRGDILLLAAGDIIPADCRLLRTDGFAVSERELNTAEPGLPPVRLEKDAAATPEATPALRVSPVNMVFAGGMALTGSALAVAVAVGQDTHLGGLMGHVPSRGQTSSMELIRKAARSLSVYNLCLFCLTVPLTVLGIFTVGDSYEFLDIFLSALALSAVTLTEPLLCKAVYAAAATRRSAALDRDGENTADIKSSATPEKLAAMTDLFLVGTAALHDGVCHPETLLLGDKVYRCDHPDADGDALTVAEYLALYRKGTACLPTAGSAPAYGELIESFCRWAELDASAFAVKVREIRPEGRGASGIFPTAEGSRRVAVYLTEDFAEAESCTHLFDGQKSIPADREGMNALYRTYRAHARQGSTPLFVLTETEGRRTLHALLTCTPHTCRKTAGCIRNLESAGIRVAAFLRGVSDSHTRVLAACGLTDGAPADRPVPEAETRHPAAEALEAGCRAFEGCSEAYILDCIRDLQAAGRTVGVLSVDGRDIAILAEADVALTCSPSLYAAAEAGHPRAEQRPETGSLAEGDGHPDSPLADDRTRRTAHVILRRSSAVGGGVLGVLRALQAADACRTALNKALRFTLLSQAVRIVLVVLPLCLGMAPAAAPAILLSGVLPELLVLAAALGLPARSTPLPRRKPGETMIRPLSAYRGGLIAAAAGAAVLWIVAWVATLCGAEMGGDPIYYGVLGLFGLQIAIFLTDRLPKRDSTVFLTALCLLLAYVGAVAVALVKGLTPLWALAVPLIGPLVFALLQWSLGKLMKS